MDFSLIHRKHLMKITAMFFQFVTLYLKRLRQEQIHVSAGYLSYVTLMSLVPLLVVTFSVMTAFPIFSEIKTDIESFVYQNFVPAAGDVVQNYIGGFVSNASKMSAVAISFLFLFALLLISSIDQSLNKLWRVTRKRRLVTAFSMYWMILTLGPVLVGSSIAATSYLVSLVAAQNYNLVDSVNIFIRALPILSATAAFLILYMVVPNKEVKFKYAIAGATLAAILFEFAKKAFAIYVTQLPSYQDIYGALAAIPLLFLWVYLSWLVVFVGAMFTVTLEEFFEHGARTEQQAQEGQYKP